MKSLLYILLFLKSFYLIGQTIDNTIYEFVYHIHYNTEYPKLKTAKLYVDYLENRSIFIENNLNKSDNIVEEDDKTVFEINLGGLNFNITDFNNGKIKSLCDIYFDKYLLVEDIPKFEWILTDDKKLLNGLNLNKALLSFRGRNYTAWYSEELKIRYGPWKFNGLPGLIVEIFDEENRYKWTLKEIKKKNNADFYFNQDVTPYDVITLKDYVKLRYNNSSLKKKLSSKLPRGSIIKTKSNYKRNGIEIKFDWEHY